MVVRVPSRRTSVTVTIGGMLSISNVVLSIDAGQRGVRRVRRRVRHDNLHRVAAVRHRRRVPHENRIGEAALQRLPGGVAFAAVEHVVEQFVAVLVLGAPDERQQPLLIGAAAERGRVGDRAAGRVQRRRAPVGRVAFEPGDLRVAGGEGTLEDGARRMNRDRRDARARVARQVGRRHGREHRRLARASRSSTARHCR